MSDYSLVQRGLISATSADGAGPKDATLASAVKPASTFVVGFVRDRRRNTFVQRGQIAAANPDVSPKDSAAFTAVDTTAAHVTATWKENRAGNARGATLKLLSSTQVRMEWDGVLAAAETLTGEFEVVEHKPRRGAFMRLLNATTVRLEWDGALVAGETIEAHYEAFDLENLGDDVKETLFRLQRMLAYLGENLLQDVIVYDDAGNMVSYRLRLFNSKVNAEAATVDTPGGLETGELSRQTVTQDINFAKNDRLSLIRVLTDLLATPGVN